MRRLFSLAASVLVTSLSVVAQAQSGPPSQSATQSNDHLCLPSRFGEQSDRSGVFQQDCTEPAVAIHGRLARH